MDMKTVALVLLGLGILFLSGCTRSAGEDIAYQASLGKDFQLKPGEVAQIASEKMFIRFLNVTEDSRCPKDALCVWAGQVSVLANLNVRGQDLGNFKLTLRPGEAALSEKTFGSPYGYTVRLISVELPYEKKAGQSIDPVDYIAKFEVISLE